MVQTRYINKLNFLRLDATFERYRDIFHQLSWSLDFRLVVISIFNILSEGTDGKVFITHIKFSNTIVK